MKKIILLLIIAVQFVSCEQDPLKDFVDLDLMKNGVPLKIKAPEGSTVKVNDLGLMKDISIDGGNNFALQIMASTVTEYDLKKLVDSELSTVEASTYFSKIMSQDENGFIFEKDIDGKLNYDFRFVKIQGDNEFICQRSLSGTYNIEEIDLMYKALE